MNLGELFVNLGAQVAQDIRTDNPTADSYVKAVARLMQHASKWAAVSASGIRCATHFRNPIGEVHPCGAAAIGACVACGQATCFNHAAISPADGRIVCYGCIGVAQRQAQQLGAEWHAKKKPPKQQQDRQSGPGISCSCRFPWQTDESCPVHGQELLRREHLETLGLDIDADWEDISRTFRKLGRKYHPDRATTSRARRSNEAKFKKISEAFEWLKVHNKEQAA